MSITEFKKYAEDYNKPYAPSIDPGAAQTALPSAVQQRFNNFQLSTDEINKINSMSTPFFQAGLTNLSDLSQKEFDNLTGGDTKDSTDPQLVLWNNMADKPCRSPIRPMDHLPSTTTPIDWKIFRNKNNDSIFTPVKTQHCNDCWAYSTTEAVETAYLQADNPMQILSTQNTTDCADRAPGRINQNSNTCKWGGAAMDGLNVAFWQQGLSTDHAYPSTCLAGTPAQPVENCNQKNCPYGQNPPTKIHMEGLKVDNPFEWNWHPTLRNYPQQIYDQLKVGPVVMPINVDNMKNYKGGVIVSGNPASPHPDDCSNHFVQVVGWNPGSGNPSDPTNPPHWIFRNSWGGQWGEDGYGKIASGQDLRHIEEYLWTARLGPAPPNKYQCNHNNWTCEQTCDPANPNCFSDPSECAKHCVKPTPSNKWKCNEHMEKCQQICAETSTSPMCFTKESQCDDQCKSPSPSHFPWWIIIIIIVILLALLWWFFFYAKYKCINGSCKMCKNWKDNECMSRHKCKKLCGYANQ